MMLAPIPAFAEPHIELAVVRTAKRTKKGIDAKNKYRKFETRSGKPSKVLNLMQSREVLTRDLQYCFTSHELLPLVSFGIGPAMLSVGLSLLVQLHLVYSRRLKKR